MVSLFCYGTLMNSRVLATVLNRTEEDPPSSQRAFLHGYRRCMVRDAKFPAVVKEEGSTVTGVLLDSLKQSDISFLDWYEGGQYERQDCVVELEDGSSVNTQFFLWTDDPSLLLLNDWDDKWMNNPETVNAYMLEELESLEPSPDI